MGSEQDIKPGDDFRRRLLAVRSVGWQGGYIVGISGWYRLIDELVEEVRRDALRGVMPFESQSGIHAMTADPEMGKGPAVS